MRRTPVQPIEGAPGVAPSLTSIARDGSCHRKGGVTATWPADLRLKQAAQCFWITADRDEVRIS
jgi:hypothetical protein